MISEPEKIKEPAKVIIYGPEGIGKTTLAADAPDPVWLDIEGSSGQLPVKRYLFRPEDKLRGHVPNTYQDVLAAVEWLRTKPHDRKTVVIDTADWLEKMIHAFVCERDGVTPDGEKEQAPGIEAYGFGKGYTVALTEWINFCNQLELLRTERYMQIIMLAHMHIKRFDPPSGQSYDRYTMRMHEKAAGFLREWAYVVGFAHYEEGAEKLDKKNKLAKAKGFDTGRRLIEFRRKATHDAKSKYALPDTVEMTLVHPWAPFARALSDAENMTVEQLTEVIRQECERIGNDDTTKKAEEYIAGGNTAVLHTVLEKLREKPSKEEAAA